MTLFDTLPAPVEFALSALGRAGFEAALVGGCVRDALMGRAPGDYDIASSASPEEAMAALRGEKLVPTGLKHGTILLVKDGMPIEITAFREDGEYADMRRPDSVRFTRSLASDVRRRDFAMNALAWEREKGLIDIVGGMEDIRRKRIRAVGEPEKRFSEDALRMLRAVRFSAQLGFDIDSETRAALMRLYPNIAHVSRERVLAELTKLFLGRNARAVILEYETVLRAQIPCADAISPSEWRLGADRLCAVLREACEPATLWSRTKMASIPLCFAAVLYAAGGERAGNALREMRADEKTARETALLLSLAREIGESTPYSLRTLAGEQGFDIARDAIRLRYAFEADARERALALLSEIQEKRLPCALGELAVNGAALQEIGITGKQTGAVLRALLNDVRADRAPNEKEALLEIALRIRDQIDSR